MRNLSASQQTSFNNETLTIASLVEVHANDGTIVKLTDHDVDLGEYVSTFGLDMSAIVVQLGGTGQTATVTTLPDKGAGGGITYQMVEGGLLDNAIVKCYWCDYTKSPLDPLQIFQGFVNEVKYGNSALLELDITSLLAAAPSLCRDVMQQTCRADFGDAKCGIDITNMIDGPHVFAPIDSQSFKMTRDEITPVGYYNNGTLRFITGENKGLGYEILTVSLADANGRETVYLKVPLAFDVAPGDYIGLYPGCDKLIDSGCTYWNNTLNFQGEPYIVDPSNILPPVSDRTVKASGINTGLPALCNWWLTQYIKIGWNKTILFTPGTRAADGEKSITVGGFVTKFFNETMLPDDAYTAIFNLLGSLDKVAAYDGTLAPIDATAVANLKAAGFNVPLDCTVTAPVIRSPTYLPNVEYVYAQLFFQRPSKAFDDAIAPLGYDDTTLPDQTTIGQV